MDPFTAVSAISGGIGLGMKIFGMDSASKAANAAYGIESNITGLQQQVNNQKQQQMELSARRGQLENFRNAQRLRAQGVNSAVGQGAQYGSGLQGSLAQNTSQSLFNSQGINQNLEIGRNIFGINNQISQQNLALSKVKSDMNTDQGWASLGGSILQSSGTIGNVAGAAWGGASKAASLWSGGSLSGGLGNT